jgi:hypothetical protein
MGLLDGLLKQVAEHVDVDNLAAKIGLTPEQVEAAVQALGHAHPEPGDTVSMAAANTGLPIDKLTEIVEQIGGEGALGRFASLLTEQGGSAAGNILGDLAGGLFKK